LDKYLLNVAVAFLIEHFLSTYLKRFICRFNFLLHFQLAACKFDRFGFFAFSFVVCLFVESAEKRERNKLKYALKA